MTNPASASLDIVHNAAAQRFEVRVKGWLCRCDYRQVDGELHLVHTEVPPLLEGAGGLTLRPGSAGPVRPLLPVLGPQPRPERRPAGHPHHFARPPRSAASPFASRSSRLAPDLGDAPIVAGLLRHS